MAGNSIVRGTNSKPVASQILADFFESNPDAPVDGELFIGYPITTAAEGALAMDALYLSPKVGVIVFDLVEGPDVGGYQDRQEDGLRRIEVKLMSHRELVKRRSRDIAIRLSAVTFAPAATVANSEIDPDYPVATDATIGAKIKQIVWKSYDPDIYRHTLSALQSVSGIRRPSSPRETKAPNSRGSILKALEGSIATLDSQQSRAVIETTTGVQRIRGLAGSGKTVVLALKAAYLHAQHPEWRIAVTFNTRSLRDQFKRLINTFTITQSGDEPDWKKVEILPAWGAPGGGERDGVYHRFCSDNGLRYFDYRSAKDAFGTDALGGACAAALAEAVEIRPSFDVILADEAQDLSPAFLRMCFHMLGDEKRLVYAYDELQNLSNAGLPPAKEIFGIGSDDRPLVSFDEPEDKSGRRDIILEKCYRNSRPVLTTAHALGFGIYRMQPQGSKTGLVQIFESKKLWGEIGYEVVEGNLQDGQRVTLSRTERSSPPFLEKHSPIEDLLQFRRFANAAEQADWLASEVKKNLAEEELVANDILIINPNPFTTRENVGIIRKRLLDLGIDSHLAGVDSAPDVFFIADRDSVTVTGIHRAKGNEAGLVYIVNAQESLASSVNLAHTRNRLFTAITRSKAWVRVSGVGQEMDALVEEFERIRENDFKLAFQYPTALERDKLRILHRDVSPSAARKVRKHSTSLSELLSDLDAGEVLPEDLDAHTLVRLRELLQDSHG